MHFGRKFLASFTGCGRSLRGIGKRIEARSRPKRVQPSAAFQPRRVETRTNEEQKAGEGTRKGSTTHDSETFPVVSHAETQDGDDE